jgi:hypothetical protein
MTDRELLEAAAKAAGYVHHVSPIDPQQHRPQHWTGWNPLTDDGDALRLAVNLQKLGVELRLGRTNFLVGVGIGPYWCEEVTDPDPYAATRRAIVRAAAEIGKEMK